MDEFVLPYEVDSIRFSEFYTALALKDKRNGYIFEGDNSVKIVFAPF